MGRDEIRAFLRTLGATQMNPRGAEWIQACCPLAPWKHDGGHDRNPSFAIKVNPNAESIYHCFSCSKTEDLVSLVFELQRRGARPPRYDLKAAMAIAVADGDRPVSLSIKREYGQPDEEELPEVQFPEKWWTKLPSALEIEVAVEYLRTRQVTRRVVKEADLKYDWQKHAILFPVRDFQGVLRQVRGRFIEPERAPYHVYRTKNQRIHPTVWYGEQWLDFDQRVVIVESVFDVLSIRRVYANVCAPMTSGVNLAKVRRMWQAIDIVTLMDRGMGGDGLRRRLQIGLSKASIVDVELPDSYKDPGKMPLSAVRHLLAPLVKLKPHEHIRTADRH